MRVLRTTLLAATLTAPIALASSAHAGAASHPPGPPPLCSTAPTGEANVNTDCQPTGNTFETSIAINPTDHRNIIGAAIRRVPPTPGVPRSGSFISEPHVSFDGGHTWAIYPVAYPPGTATDPSVAFDAEGSAYLATTNSSGPTSSIVVTRSVDQGRTWDTPVSVTSTASLPRGGVFNDHPQLAAFDNGDLLVTWIREVFGPDGLVTAPVADSVSHDGGATWSAPTIISGAAPFCTGRQGGQSCDQTFGNAVAVSRAGAVVTFQETYNEADDAGSALGRNKFLSVTVDAGTGYSTGGPFLIGQAYDGILEHDYPLNFNGVQTLHDSQFALDSLGNVAADPTRFSGEHFAVVWYDDRNAVHPVATDPYQAVTNSDIIVSQSYDGGRTWSPPTAITEPNDQFMPWAAYGIDGRLRVGYFDRIYDPANDKYGYTLATERRPGTLGFALSQVTTALSDPTRNSTASPEGTINPAFPNPAANVGDYSGIAADRNQIVAYWTDMRETTCVNGKCGSKEDAYFASVRGDPTDTGAPVVDGGPRR